MPTSPWREALTHGGIANNSRVNLNWIDSEVFETRGRRSPSGRRATASSCPAASANAGTEGKIAAVRFAREHKVPYFGICFGMQMAVIEVARALAGIRNASSTEFGPCAEPVVGLMTEWVRGNVVERRNEAEPTWAARCASAPMTAGCSPSSQLREIYGEDMISERHRHRYEVNINYKERLETAGLRFSGMSPDGLLPEMMEMPGHPWFIGVQFHPELKSKPFDPHPLFTSFIGAAIQQSRLV